MIEHVPAVSGVTEEPLTVQTLVEFDAKLTVNPELAVAVSESAEAGRVTVPGALNVIVCVPCVTLNVCVTGVAAA